MAAEEVMEGNIINFSNERDIAVENVAAGLPMTLGIWTADGTTGLAEGVVDGAKLTAIFKGGNPLNIVEMFNPADKSILGTLKVRFVWKPLQTEQK